MTDKKIECESVKKEIEKILNNAGIKARVETRLKSEASIRQKIEHKNILPMQVLDIIGIRIIAKNVSDCYEILHLIVTRWDVLASKIKDYIAIPKPNGYQSIHLTIVEKGFPIEIQIRTQKMERKATFGSYSHSRYKKNAA